MLSIHATLAEIVKAPELALSDVEANKLAAAISAVQAEFPATRLDPKVAVLVNFAGVAGMIYGSRVVMIRMRKNVGNAPPKPAPHVDVHPQPTADEPAPAAANTFNPTADFVPFGTEGPKPSKPLDFPITA